MSVTIVIKDEDVKNMVKVMRSAGRDLRREMGKEIRHVAKPVVDDMRSEISGMSLPATGGAQPYTGPTGGGGITGRIAAATKVSITQSGVRIRVATGALGNAAKLPAYIDAGTTWRHPVMGNRKAWVSQTASRPGWFTKTGIEHHPQIKRQVLEILNRYATMLAARL
jgi:hypothetical protein